jgi:type IV pilus assembly protein PilN
VSNFNLLPWREQQREIQRRRFYIHISFALISTVILVVFAHFSLQQKIQYQNSRNHYLTGEIQQLNKKIAQMTQLKNERTRLIERINTIEKLQAMRPASVHLFDEIANTLPNGIYLTHLLQSDAHIHLVGKTKSNTHVSEYMNRLNQSTWLSSSNLKGISTQNANTQSSHLRDFDLQVIQRQHHAAHKISVRQP